jgi:beta-galactosidase
VEGAEKEGFDNSSWRTLDVPHDWSIEGSYDESNPVSIAGAFLPAGIGWYRKTIDIEKLRGYDQYFVEFDGVYMNSDVWINGVHLGTRPNGYISFSYNLTPFLKDEKNVLAVRVDHSRVPSGRWYTGSGIYRHVWLTKTKNVYIPQ